MEHSPPSLSRSFCFVPDSRAGRGFLCKELSLPSHLPEMEFTHMAVLVWLNDAMLNGVLSNHARPLRMVRITVDMEEAQ